MSIKIFKHYLNLNLKAKDNQYDEFESEEKHVLEQLNNLEKPPQQKQPTSNTGLFVLVVGGLLLLILKWINSNKSQPTINSTINPTTNPINAVPEPIIKKDEQNPEVDKLKEQKTEAPGEGKVKVEAPVVATGEGEGKKTEGTENQKVANASKKQQEEIIEGENNTIESKDNYSEDELSEAKPNIVQTLIIKEDEQQEDEGKEQEQSKKEEQQLAEYQFQKELKEFKDKIGYNEEENKNIIAKDKSLFKLFKLFQSQSIHDFFQSGNFKSLSSPEDQQFTITYFHFMKFMQLVIDMMKSVIDISTKDISNYYKYKLNQEKITLLYQRLEIDSKSYTEVKYKADYLQIVELISEEFNKFIEGDRIHQDNLTIGLNQVFANINDEHPKLKDLKTFYSTISNNMNLNTTINVNVFINMFKKYIEYIKIHNEKEKQKTDELNANKPQAILNENGLIQQLSNRKQYKQSELFCKDVYFNEWSEFIKCLQDLNSKIFSKEFEIDKNNTEFTEYLDTKPIINQVKYLEYNIKLCYKYSQIKPNVLNQLLHLPEAYDEDKTNFISQSTKFKICEFYNRFFAEEIKNKKKSLLILKDIKSTHLIKLFTEYPIHVKKIMDSQNI